MIPEGTVIKIVRVNKASLWYPERAKFIGKTAIVLSNGLGYWKDTKCHFGWIKMLDGEEHGNNFCFHQVRIKILSKKE